MQDDVEIVALSMVEVLGYDRKVDWSRVYVGNGMEADGSLRALCYDLAAAALSAATPAIEARATAAIVAWLRSTGRTFVAEMIEDRAADLAKGVA